MPSSSPSSESAESTAPETDPLSATALAIVRKPGSYALLLGSGVSRPAQIPTSWEIVKNLIQRLAAADKENPEPDPIAWYRDRYGNEPAYGAILDQLTSTQAERSQIIAPFIEPNEEERAAGLKAPTDAHRAIAELVETGYVRVIVTTNFDRLLEIALAEVGIVPTVIASTSDLASTFPLVHNRCTIVKLHGDYMSTAILNTSEELGAYPPDTCTLLAQIFRDYGLIISGWSGEWDEALRNQLCEHPSPWFGTLWGANREPSVSASPIIKARGAKVVTRMSADELFTQISERARAIAALDGSANMTPAMVQQLVKRYVDDPMMRIRLSDLVIGEARRIHAAISGEPASFYRVEITPETVTERLKHYESMVANLCSMLAVLGYWSLPSQWPMLKQAIEIVGSVPEPPINTVDEWLKLRRIPVALALYSAGVAAMASENYGALYSALDAPRASSPPWAKGWPVVRTLAFEEIMGRQVGRQLFGDSRRHPHLVSDWFAENQLLTETLSGLAPGEDFLRYFDRFEYLKSLAYAFYRRKQGQGIWGPMGQFAWRWWGGSSDEVVGFVEDGQARFGDDWGLLQAGMFGGSSGELSTIRDEHDRQMNQFR